MTIRTDRRLADLLSDAEHRVSRRLSGVLQADGLTLDQWRVLSLLADGAGHPMNVVADHVRLPPATLTRLIDRLVEVNLIYRRADLADRRRVLVHLAPRGRSLYRRLAAGIEREEAALVAVLDAEERVLLAELLGRLAGTD